MMSLRARLSIILLLSTGLVWASAVGWIYLRSQAELEHVLDTRLQEAARMVSSLVTAAGTSVARADGVRIPALPNYERQLSCQVWSVDGRLLAKSSGAPDTSLSEATEGFSDRDVDGEAWRVYVVADPSSGIRVMVGDRLGLRDRLITDLLEGLVIPIGMMAPILVVLIWASVGRGLRPLRVMAHGLAAREVDDIRPLATSSAPSEVIPLANALNLLLSKLESARSHEREFIAFAAHELRTPLTGLKMQAQIAMASNDGAVVRSALMQIVGSVDRSTRLIRQLLTLARLEAHEDEGSFQPVELGPLLRSVVTELGDRNGEVQTDIDPRLMIATCPAKRECLELVLRNLQENALKHTRSGGTIHWSFATDRTAIVVEDEGPGIPADELDKVSDPFFRGRYRTGLGSGLGLAIVATALRTTGATFRLCNRPHDAGLRVEVTCPIATNLPKRPA